MKSKTKIYYLFFSLFVFFTFSALGQNSIGLNLGVSSYEGDLHCFEQLGLNVLNSGGLTFGLQEKRNLNQYFSARFAYQFARFRGNDQRFDQASGHPERNFSFTNNMHELTGKLDLEPFRNWKVSPFVSIGAGVAFNNPKTIFDLSGKSIEQLAKIDEDQVNLPTLIFAVPVGLGFNVNLSNQLGISAEFAMRMPFSDYLDGVSSSAFSEFNDYFGIGVIGFNYKLGAPKLTTSEKVSVKDHNLAEQMINVHPPSADPGEMEKSRSRAQKVNNSKSEKVNDPSTSDDVQKSEMKTDSVEATKPDEVSRDIIALEASPLLEPDTDNDGLIDKLDDCPMVYAKTANGCPENTVNEDVDCQAEFGPRTIQFETSFSELSNLDKARLNDAVAILTACPDVKLTIEGHTDSSGSELINQALSEKRAKAVKAYIVSRGIDAKRIKTFGYSENQPIADNSTKEGRSLNRRVVVSFF